MAENYTYLAPPFPSMNGLIQRDTDSVFSFIPLDLGNMDYQTFLAWIAEGNPAPAGWTGPTNASPSTG